MADNLSVTITADVTDLTAKLALAQENVKQTTAELSKLSKSMLDAGTTASASLRGGFTEAAAASAGAHAEIAKLKAQMEEATSAASGFAGSTSTITREMLVLGREAARGNFSRMAGSMTILATTGFGLGTAMLAGAAGVAALVGGLAYFEIEAIKAANAGKALEGIAAFRGLSIGRDSIDALVKEINKLPGASQADAEAVVATFLRMKDASVPVMQAMIDILPAVSAEMGEKMPEAAKQLADAMSDPVRAGDAFLEKIGASRQAVANFDADIAKGDIAGARETMLQALADGSDRYQEKTRTATQSTRQFLQVIQALSNEGGGGGTVEVLQQQIDALDPARIKKAADDLKTAFASIEQGPTQGAPIEAVRAQIAQISASWQGSQAGLIEVEIQTWTKRIAVGDLYGKQLQEAEAELSRAQIALRRGAQAETEKINRENATAFDRDVKAETQAAVEADNEQITSANRTAARKEAATQSDFQAGKITRAQETADLIAEENERYAKQVAALNATLSLYSQEEAGYKKAKNEILDAAEDNARKITEIQTKAAAQTKQQWQSAARPIEGAFGSAVTGMLLHGQTLQQGMANIGESIVSTMINKVIQYIVDEWIIAEGIKLLASQTTATGQEAAEGESAVTTGLIAKATAVQQILASAAVAAAGAFAATAAIPFIGPELAPEAAAAAFGATAAWAGVASAAGGMLSVPSDNFLISAHMGESVLPANIAGPMRDFFSDDGAAEGGGGGGDLHVHGSLVTITGGSSLTADQIAKAVQKGIRDFHPAYR